jgi:hypothetical protein
MNVTKSIIINGKRAKLSYSNNIDALLIDRFKAIGQLPTIEEMKDKMNLLKEELGWQRIVCHNAGGLMLCLGNRGKGEDLKFIEIDQAE